MSTSRLCSASRLVVELRSPSCVTRTLAESTSLVIVASWVSSVFTIAPSLRAAGRCSSLLRSGRAPSSARSAARRSSSSRSRRMRSSVSRCARIRAVASCACATARCGRDPSDERSLRHAQHYPIDPRAPRAGSYLPQMPPDRHRAAEQPHHRAEENAERARRRSKNAVSKCRYCCEHAHREVRQHEREHAAEHALDRALRSGTAGG